jgi:hypothetical protein
MIEQKIFEDIKNECIDLGYIIDDSYGKLFVTNKKNIYTIAISISQENNVVFIEDNNDSLYRLNSSTHNKLEEVIEAIKIRLEVD